MTTGRLQMDVIIVHYHAAGFVRDAVAALRADAGTEDIELHIIVADNGSTPDERYVLRSMDIHYINTGTNAGYAGGVKASFGQTKSSSIVLMNEDVLVLPGCLRALHDALASGAAAAGPEFYWDRDLVFRLPCTEERNRRAELLKVGARRTGSHLERARSAWREHARRHWRAEQPIPTTSLSGAMIAFRRDVWNTVGPFDSGFRLYFEENDWLRRISMFGLESLYIPAAKAIHLHNPKLASTTERLQMEAESFVRYGNRYYGETFMRRLMALSRREGVLPPWQQLTDDNGFEIRLDNHHEWSWPLWIELTISPFGFPAATTLLVDSTAKSWKMPPMRGLSSLDGTLYLQVVDDEGRELFGYTLQRTAPQELSSVTVPEVCAS